MKRIIRSCTGTCLLLATIFICGICSGQRRAFNGTYKGTSNGVTYILKLKNDNSGKVTGTIRNTEYAGAGSVINAVLLDESNIKGTQTEWGIKIKFIATEEDDALLWELRGWLIESMLTRKDRSVRFEKLDSGISTFQPSETLDRQPSQDPTDPSANETADPYSEEH